MNYKTSDSIFQKRVSFILITKDRQDHLNKMINTLNKIKNNNDEIIVVNGGNADISNELVSAHIKEPDISPGHAVNKGILIAKGKYTIS